MPASPMTIFKLGKEKEVLAEVAMASAVYTTPIVANNILYIVNRNRLYAIKDGASSKPADPRQSSTARTD